MEKHWFPYSSLFLSTDVPELQLKCNGQGGQLEQTGTCGFRINTLTAVAIVTVIHGEYCKYLAEVNISRIKFLVKVLGLIVCHLLLAFFLCVCLLFSPHLPEETYHWEV